MLDRYHLLIAHHPIHILKLSIFIIVVRGITGIKPEALLPLLIMWIWIHETASVKVCLYNKLCFLLQNSAKTQRIDSEPTPFIALSARGNEVCLPLPLPLPRNNKKNRNFMKFECFRLRYFGTFGTLEPGVLK